MSDFFPAVRVAVWSWIPEDTLVIVVAVCLLTGLAVYYGLNVLWRWLLTGSRFIQLRGGRVLPWVRRGTILSLALYVAVRQFVTFGTDYGTGETGFYYETPAVAMYNRYVEEKYKDVEALCISNEPLRSGDKNVDPSECYKIRHKTSRYDCNFFLFRRCPFFTNIAYPFYPLNDANALGDLYEILENPCRFFSRNDHDKYMDIYDCSGKNEPFEKQADIFWDTYYSESKYLWQVSRLVMGVNDVFDENKKSSGKFTIEQLKKTRSELSREIVRKYPDSKDKMDAFFLDLERAVEGGFLEEFHAMQANRYPYKISRKNVTLYIYNENDNMINKYRKQYIKVIS